MRGSNRFVLAAVAVLASASPGVGLAVAGDITRCTDAAGKVSYTDKACPSSTRRAKQLDGIETNGTSIPVPGGEALPAARIDRETATPARVAAPRPGPAPSDSGLVVIDPGANVPQQASTNRGDPYRDDGDSYFDPHAGYPGAYRRRLVQPQDLRPTLRNCDAGGCSDTLGNHYDRGGKVDRYTRPDGRTCRPIGTTVVC